MTVFRRILVATDFSEASAPAVTLAVKLAKSWGAQLLAAHVYDEPHLPELSFAHVRLYEEYERKIKADAARQLGEIAGHARAEGVETEELLLRGFADEAIVQAARESHADLIVMGTHGRRGAGRFFLGSVAARVVATAPCPVLTARAA
ncbi:MAG: universal stress protein [Thermoanaerobaculia bacterium]